MTVSLAYLHTRTLMASALENMFFFWRAESEPRFLMKSGQWLSHEIYEMSYIYIHTYYIHIILYPTWCPHYMAIINNMVANYPRDSPSWLSSPQWKRWRYPLGISRNPFPRSYSTPPQRNHVLVVGNFHIWLVVWNCFYFSIYWENSSQLTFIFSEGRYTTKQI